MFANDSDARTNFETDYRNHVLEAQDLFSGVMTVRSFTKTSPNMRSYFPVNIAIFNYDVQREAADTFSAATWKVRPIGQVLQTPYAIAHPLLMNLNLDSYWVGGDDVDGVGSTRRVFTSYGNEQNVENLSTVISSQQSPYDRYALDTDAKTFFPDRIQTSKNFEHPSPYLLKKTDEIVLGFQTATPGFHTGMTDYMNQGGGQLTDQFYPNGNVGILATDNAAGEYHFINEASALPRNHAATIHPYANSKLVLYGSYIKNELPRSAKKTIVSNLIYESIGSEIHDQNLIYLDSELSGSMYSEIMSKPSFAVSEVDDDGNIKTVSVTFSERTNDIGGHPQQIFASGSVDRFYDVYQGYTNTKPMRNENSISYDLVWFDSLPVDLNSYWPANLRLLSGSIIDLGTSHYDAEPDNATDSTHRDFSPAFVISKKSGELDVEQALIGIGSFTKVTTVTNRNDQGATVDGATFVGDLYSGLSRNAFENVFNDRWTRGFIFDNSTDIDNDGNPLYRIYQPATDPQDFRSLSKDSGFGLTGKNQDLGILVQSDSLDRVGFSLTNYPTAKMLDITEVDNLNQAKINEFIAGYNNSPHFLASVRVITQPSTNVSNDGKIALTKHNRISPFRKLQAVNQVNNTHFRQNAAAIFGYGTRSDRGLRYISGNGFVPWEGGPGFPIVVTHADIGATTYYYHQRNTRVLVEHPAGVKYGMMNYDHIRPSVKFRVDRFGQARDMLEGRKFGAFANLGINQEQKDMGTVTPSVWNGNQTTAVEVVFRDASGVVLAGGGYANSNVLFSQNLDRLQRSGIPFFDLPTPNEDWTLAADVDTSAWEYGALGGRLRKENEIPRRNLAVAEEIDPDLEI